VCPLEAIQSLDFFYESACHLLIPQGYHFLTSPFKRKLIFKKNFFSLKSQVLQDLQGRQVSLQLADAASRPLFLLPSVKKILLL
jgi:hypothetical protein